MDPVYQPGMSSFEQFSGEEKYYFNICHAFYVQIAPCNIFFFLFIGKMYSNYNNYNTNNIINIK